MVDHDEVAALSLSERSGKIAGHEKASEHFFEMWMKCQEQAQACLAFSVFSAVAFGAGVWQLVTTQDPDWWSYLLVPGLAVLTFSYAGGWIAWRRAMDMCKQYEAAHEITLDHLRQHQR